MDTDHRIITARDINWELEPTPHIESIPRTGEYLNSLPHSELVDYVLDRYCDAEHVEFIGIDSVGLACDGKLIDDDVAIRFHRALSALPPSLCAAHVPKSSINVDSKAESSAFGSVYFTNLCRASWNVRKQPGATDDVVTVGLYAQKQNDGERSKPVGLQFTFTADRISVSPVDLASVEGLAERLPLAQRMAHLLKTGPLTLSQLADELGQGGLRHEGREPQQGIHQDSRQRWDYPDRARREAGCMSRKCVPPPPSVTGRTGQDNTLKGVLSVQSSALDMSIDVLDKLSNATAKRIRGESRESIRCWRNWPSDGEPVVVWCGSHKVTLNDWYRGRK